MVTCILLGKLLILTELVLPTRVWWLSDTEGTIWTVAWPCFFHFWLTMSIHCQVFHLLWIHLWFNMKPLRNSHLSFLPCMLCTEVMHGLECSFCLVFLIPESAITAPPHFLEPLTSCCLIEIWRFNSIAVHCRFSWLTMVWPRSIVTTAHGSTLRTERTRTWQAQLVTPASTLTWASSRAVETTWSPSAMSLCTSTEAVCPGKDSRSVGLFPSAHYKSFLDRSKSDPTQSTLASHEHAWAIMNSSRDSNLLALEEHAWFCLSRNCYP